MKSLYYTLLGTGSSHGIPSIGCDCSVCTSSEPKNSRRRCSLYLSCDNTHLVIDTPPDFREQVLNYGVSQIDALFITHAHADHIMGFDDVRRLSHRHKTGLPVYSHPETLLQMRTKFDYVLKSSYAPNTVPKIQFIPQEEPLQIGSLTITPLPVPHGAMATYGYRVETPHHALAYIPDCQAIPAATLHLLQDLDLMILNALRPEPHPNHLTIEQSIAYLKQIRARKSLITHIAHNSEHFALQKQLKPDHIIVPWDGYNGVLK